MASKIPDGFIDYYVVYSLDRKDDTKTIRKILLKMQGEYCSQASGGSLNDPAILAKLQENKKNIAEAIKTFKNDERRKEYDAMLDAAYEVGKIDVEAQAMAQDLYEEIEAMFMRGNYQGVVRKCMDALNNNVRDYRIYLLLARSYYALNDALRSLKTVDDGLQIHSENMPLLKAGARFSNEGTQDYDRAQGYVNRMMEIDPESPIAAAEQSYLYLTNGKADLAYQMIDEYLEKHPTDQEFRQNCAYDLIGYSYSCYTKVPEGDAYVIASEEDYQKSLDVCNKAASLYSDENTQAALDDAKYFGTVEYNKENTEYIIWLFVGGIMYCLSLYGAVIGIPLLYAGYRLRKLSYRPYWQINMSILTGEQAPDEKKYVLIGKIFTGYIKWSFKIAWELVKLAFRLGMGY